MRTLLPALILALVAAPLAAAQETEKNETPERPDDAAWVEDCPPDMMCAAQAPPDEPTYDGDCGGEVCAYDEPGRLGPDDCIECMAPVDDGASCMEGQQEGEACRDDVQYLDGPSRGPSDGSCETCRGEDAEAASASSANVPAPALALALVGLAGAALLAIPRR